MGSATIYGMYFSMPRRVVGEREKVADSFNTQKSYSE